MLEIRDKNVSTPEVRKQNISSWQEAPITRLNSKAKKRFSKNKSAIIAYFTGDKPIREIATQYNLSTEQLLKMAENCLKQHEDGSPWGYRALLPGVLVKDHSVNPTSTQSEAQNTTSDNAPSIQELQTNEPPIVEIDASSNEIEIPVAETDNITDTTEFSVPDADTIIHEMALENGEAPSLEDRSILDGSSLPGTDSSVEETELQENQPSSTSEESLLEEDVPTEPIAVEEQVVENAEETALQEPVTSSDEQQKPLQQEEPSGESEIKASVGDTQVQLQQGAKVTAPLPPEETSVS